jgi:hypothetical protein
MKRTSILLFVIVASMMVAGCSQGEPQEPPGDPAKNNASHLKLDTGAEGQAGGGQPKSEGTTPTVETP